MTWPARIVLMWWIAKLAAQPASVTFFPRKTAKARIRGLELSPAATELTARVIGAMDGGVCSATGITLKMRETNGVDVKDFVGEEMIGLGA
jgi:hypothetical protein